LSTNHDIVTGEYTEGSPYGDIGTQTSNCAVPPVESDLFIFDEVSGASNNFTVGDTGVIIKGYLIPDNQRVIVEMVSGCGNGSELTPLKISSTSFILSNTDNILVIPFSGRYRLRVLHLDIPFNQQDMVIRRNLDMVGLTHNYTNPMRAI
jgi:hypothetical protein